MKPHHLAWVYDRIARLYDLIRPIWIDRDAERALDDLVAERISSSSRVLDLGAGTGANLRRLLKHAPGFGSYLGLDFSDGMIARAANQREGDPRILWMMADIAGPIEYDGSYDFILSSWMLSHLKHPETVVQHAQERLAPGGTAAFVFFSVPHSAWRARLTAPFMRMVQCHRIDPALFSSIPNFERSESFHHGACAIVVFKRPIINER